MVDRTKAGWIGVGLALVVLSWGWSARATKYFTWDAESDATSLGPISGYFDGTTRDCTVAHRGACSMRLDVIGDDHGNQQMGIDGDQNPYGWNIVGSRSLYYRWWMRIEPGFSWGSGTAKTKSSRVLGGAQGDTGNLMDFGFLVGECDGGRCTTNSGGANTDENLFIPYDSTTKDDGLWHEYIVRVKPNTSASCTAPASCDAELEAWGDGVEIVSVPITSAGAPPPVVRYDAEVPVGAPTRDTWYVVIVDGDTPMTSVRLGVKPRSITNAIIVDRDGDGIFVAPGL